MPALTTGENAGWTWDGKMLMSDPDGTSSQEGVTIGYMLNNYTKLPVTSKTADYTVIDLDQPGAYGIYHIDCTANSFTITLPDSSATNQYRPWIVTNSGSGTITVTTVGGTQIVGNDSVSTSVIILPGQSYTFHSTGTAYRLI